MAENSTRKNNLSGVKKGGDGRSRFVQTLLTASDHLSISVIAMERDIPLAKLIEEIIKDFLTKQKEEQYGKR